ncbi:unnamed protein product [marine sediment metagenome]|uniref:Uncharacterized protein n=1 Tax=marine sediment metagenome TaxID=412755 RepID=X1NGE9_9ZZZZ
MIVESRYLFKEIERINCINLDGSKRLYTVVTLKYVLMPNKGLPITFCETKTFESKDGNSAICIRYESHKKNTSYEELVVEHEVAILNAKHKCDNYHKLAGFKTPRKVLEEAYEIEKPF